MKAAILALIIGGLVLGGIAAADEITVETNLVGPVTLADWMDLVETMVVTPVPAFSTAWVSAIADATNIDPEYNLETADKPYTSTAALIGSGNFDTYSLNERAARKDPAAGLNLTVQSIAALANTTGPIPVFAGSLSTFNATAYAASMGATQITATGLYEAGTVAAFNTTAWVNPTQAQSVISGSAVTAVDWMQ